MRIEPFRLERYFAKYEFSTRYLLSPSDCESWSLGELLDLASPESRASWEQLRFGYTDSQGNPALRACIAGLYDTVGPQQTVVAVPEEAIFVVMHALLEPADRVVVLTPAYQSLHEVARSCECEVVCIPLSLAGDGWELDLDRLNEAVTPATRLLVVNFPHNPTGYLPSRRDFDAVVEIARKNGTWLLSDEMYRLLEHDTRLRLPAVCDVYEKGISLSGLSKAFGLPGLRVGWLATRDDTVIHRSLKIKDYTTICNSAPSEVLGTMGLDAREHILARNREIVLGNLAAARRHLTGPRFRWIEPQAGSIAFPLWTGPGTVDAFCREMLAERQIMIAPGSLFDHPGNHFRVGLGRRDFPEVVARVTS